MRHPSTAACTTLALAISLLADPPGAAHAANFCVGTAAELEDALQQAATNGASDTVRVKIGTYVADSNGFDYFSTEGKGLTVRGGYIEFLGSCAHITDDPTATVLDAPVQGAALDLEDQSPSATGTPLYRIEGLTFQDGFAGLAFDNSFSAVSMEVEIVGNVIRRTDSWPLYLAVRGNLDLWNNLVVDNGTAEDPLVVSGVGIHLYGAATSGHLTHNTVANNFLFAGDSALDIDCGGSAVDLGNNILFANSGGIADLDVEGSCTSAVTYNDLGVLVGNPDVSCCNVSVDPQFLDPAGGDYGLAFGSPAADVGDLTPEGGLPPTDIVGNPRLNQVLPDLGAYELPWVFVDGFETGGTGEWSKKSP